MTELTDLSEVDASNTLITGANVGEGCAPSGINNAIRNMAGLIRRAFKSSIFRVRDSTDQTKLMAVDLSGLATGTTYTLRPQAWETISTTTMSAGDWRGIDLSPFRDLRIRGYLLPSTDGVELRLRTSTNNGSSFDGGASAYSYFRIYGFPNDPAADGTITTQINLSGTAFVGNGSGEGTHFTVEVFNFNKPLFARFELAGTSLTTSGAYTAFKGGGLALAANARNALSIFFSDGNIASGYVELEGIRG